MKITIDTKEPKSKKPLFIKDLKAGDVFQWKFNERWQPETFLMINPDLRQAGQCFDLTQNILNYFFNMDYEVRVFTEMSLSGMILEKP